MARAFPARSQLVRRVASCLVLWMLASAVTGAARAASTEGNDAPAGELERARGLIEAGSFQEAVSLLRRTVERHPQDADAHLLLGTALALVPRRSEALEELETATRLRPDFAPGHHALGMALSRFVEPQRARRAFERALELDPGLAAAHVHLALLLAQAGDVEGALAHFERAQAAWGETPEAAYAHYLSGMLHAERDQPERAVAALERALELRPEDAKALLQLGLARGRLGDSEGCIAALGKAVALAPDDARARYELGRELLRTGRAEDAIPHLSAAVERQPEDRGALYSLTRALRTAGRTQEAAELGARLRQLTSRTGREDRKSFEAGRLNNEGIELEESGRMQAAIERYRAALELDPLNTVFRRNLALALCRIDRWSEGARELEEVLHLDPDDEQASRALYLALEKADPRP